MKESMHTNEIKSTVRVGKSGLTDAVIHEIVSQLKKRKIVKIKFLKSTRELGRIQSLAQELADKTGAKILDVRGGTVVLLAQGDKNA